MDLLILIHKNNNTVPTTLTTKNYVLRFPVTQSH